MQCKCGGEMSDHDVVRDNEKHGAYKKCTGCGRIHWITMSKRLAEEVDWRKAYAVKCQELYGDEIPEILK